MFGIFTSTKGHFSVDWLMCSSANHFRPIKYPSFPIEQYLISKWHSTWSKIADTVLRWKRNGRCSCCFDSTNVGNYMMMVKGWWNRKKSHHSWPESLATWWRQQKFEVWTGWLSESKAISVWCQDGFVTSHAVDVRLIQRKQNTVEVWLKTCQRAFPLLRQYKAEKAQSRKSWLRFCILTPTESHKIHPPNNQIWKCHLKFIFCNSES